MTQFSVSPILLFINLISNLFNVGAVKCYDNDNPYSKYETCEGDFCVIIREQDSHTVEITQACVTGIKMPSVNCELDYEDTLHCYCNTDFCNAPNLFRSNHTVLPIIECKEVYEKNYKATACNKCTWRVDHLKYDHSLDPTLLTSEKVNCGGSGESGSVNLDLKIQIYDRICPNFFVDACYNVTMNPEQYTLYCRCTTANCNNPELSLPFPLSPPRISCYTSGFDADINNGKYETSEVNYWDNYNNLTSFENYYDEGIQCGGHFCFIVPDKIGDRMKYYKGCITANEQGEHKIQLGYMYVNNVPYYICNTDFCNLDIETVLAEARNGTLTCVTGAKIPSHTCALDYDDAIHCYCQTDYCNAPNMFRMNITVLPVIECKEVLQKEYRAAACNKCLWKVEYIAYDRTATTITPWEDVLCGNSGESAPFNLDLTVQIYDRIGKNFFVDACYNVSMNPQQYVQYCRCTTANCNNPELPLPFPLSPPRISCYTSGHDASINSAKYETLERSAMEVYDQLTSNESYYDEGKQCEGHFCFIVPSKMDIQMKYYKGCITANEQGENKIQVYLNLIIIISPFLAFQLGYMFINDVAYYICNTDFCNLDIETALEEARNGTIVYNESNYLNLSFLYFSLSFYSIFD
ncbi:hypothetical protein CRE_27259 [Caenorhabditis remanei]|uniref:DUF7622 domain-containing protein n=1 Tax=Caenorhabditis remanei TaxID=31234 RepID=E3LPB4_CAERE|nr:hypothetical protein CRE_27259 [Caenorhabditis remanei]